MPTRGLVSVCHKGVYYTLYTHCDSYPHGMGARVVDLLAKYPGAEHWRSLLNAATFIDAETHEQPPTAELLEKLRCFILSSEESTSTWGSTHLEHFDIMFLHPYTVIRDSSLFLRCHFDHDRFGHSLVRCRNLGVWWYISQYARYDMELLHYILELGYLVYTEKESTEAPEADMFDAQFTYTINSDAGTFSACSSKSEEEVTFKMDLIPKHWPRCLDMPTEWIRLAHAFSPRALRKIMETAIRSNSRHEVWELVLRHGFSYDVWERRLEWVHHRLLEAPVQPRIGFGTLLPPRTKEELQDTMDRFFGSGKYAELKPEPEPEPEPFREFAVDHLAFPVGEDGDRQDLMRALDILFNGVGPFEMLLKVFEVRAPSPDYLVGSA